MSFLSIFRPLKSVTTSKWKELGVYQATFNVFGTDAYRSALVRACIRPLADMSSKAEAKCEDKQLERMINNRPNMYMNGTEFLKKVRTRLELLNTSFVYIQRDDRLKVVGLYPVPYTYFEALEYANGLFIKFYFADGTTLTLPWDDLVVVRKDYNASDISGDDNSAIISTLELLNTADQGLANSIKSTANLRGILKSTKAMLAPEKVKEQKEQFVADYMNLDNTGGIASLDSTQEFTPINLNPKSATQADRKDIREDVFRYFGVNDDIIMGNIKTEQLENFYRLRIEPFLIDLARELTSKIYTGKAAAVEKNVIVFMTDIGAFMTMNQKLQLFSTVVLYGGTTINEWRKLMGYGPIEGGDTPIRRLDADYINGSEKPRIGNESVDEKPIEETKEEEEEDNAESEN